MLDLQAKASLVFRNLFVDYLIFFYECLSSITAFFIIFDTAFYSLLYIWFSNGICINDLINVPRISQPYVPIRRLIAHLLSLKTRSTGHRECLKGPANRALRAQTAIVINTCNYRLSRIRLLQLSLTAEEAKRGIESGSSFICLSGAWIRMRGVYVKKYTPDRVTNVPGQY